MFDLDLDRTATDGIEEHIEALQEADSEELARIRSNGSTEEDDDE